MGRSFDMINSQAGWPSYVVNQLPLQVEQMAPTFEALMICTSDHLISSSFFSSFI